MKKILSMMFICIMVLTLSGCKKKEEPKPVEPNKPVDSWIDQNEPVGSKHLIKDAKGNFGGTLNESLYGKGTPLNGEADFNNSEYYVAPDYYYYKSNDSRTIHSKFRSYQQTMKDSDGLACILMALNYYGEDVLNTYTEEFLVKKYEEVNNTIVYGNNTTPVGLVNVCKAIGYDAEVWNFTPEKLVTPSMMNFGFDIMDNLNSGNVVLLKTTGASGFTWKAVIGIDNMETIEYPKDDVLIFADPFDTSDHVQDGYFTFPLNRIYSWWLEFTDKGDIVNQRQAIIIKTKKEITKVYAAEIEKITQDVPELHLILNKDGSYGGTRDQAKYNGVTEKNGMYDHLTSGYFKFPDYYNMINNNTRVICTNFRAFQQTMGSTCGICATLECLAYYGVNVDYDTELVLNNQYEKKYNATIKGNGTSAYGLSGLVKDMGYESHYAEYYKDKYVDENSKIFKTYNDFKNFIKPLIESGTPVPVSWRPMGGHWEVIIGFDDMGTENIYDDVIILADSHDIQDHYQDGYNTYSATLFFNQWFNKSGTKNQGHYYFLNK